MQVKGVGFATLLVAVLACSGADSAGIPPVPPPPPPPNSPPPSGVGRVDQFGTFHSNLLNNDRAVHVYLPAGYDTGSERYPVLYVHDGLDAFGGEMNYDRTATTLIASGAIRPLIIVAVDQIVAIKDHEYTPFPGFGGQLYARALVEELKPQIDSRYRTRPGPDDTGVGGKSEGGLISWYMALAYPGVFHVMFAESSPLAWGNNFIPNMVQNFPGKVPIRIWYDRGTNDGEDIHHHADSLIRNSLLAKGEIEGVDFKYFLAPGATHSEGAFAARVDPILRFLYPRN
ncbi:MAG TPA: alpha/beta hydrolase-fold protein [Gemmatimonadales bacterium]|jgi:predicted alpha/beta superfamily hydrolase|nr:alpha/beta hydrolase-fold protein [Gemmatimonadales bacterium]